MTRTAPLVTLLAVGVLGGALFVTNVVGLPAPDPAAPVTAAPAPAGSRTEIALSDIPVAGAPQAGTEISRTEIALSDIPIAQAPAASAPPDTVYAGRTEDGASTVAVAVKDGQAVAYVCDGADLEVWLKGPTDGGTLELEDKTGASTMRGTADGGGVEGTVTVDGTDYDYSASAVDVGTAVENGRPDVGDVAKRAGMAAS